MKKKYVIIVAGGKGLRMGNDIPKQFLILDGLPILMHSIKVFHEFDPAISIILVIPTDHFSYWESLKKEYKFSIPHSVVKGGAERFFSVKNGLDSIPDEESLVAIHDGVRPLVSKETIASCFADAEKFSSAIPVINTVDSIRYVTPESNKPLNRNYIKLVQTPQTFYTKKIKEAFNQNYSEAFTDDATVFEMKGFDLHLVSGNPENIKITKPSDLQIAEVYIHLSKKNNETK